MTVINAKEDFSNLLNMIRATNPDEGKLLTDFFNNPLIAPRWNTTPGSTALRFHHAFDGGLLQHVMEVFHVVMKLAEVNGEPANIGGKKGFNFTRSGRAFVPLLDIWLAVLLHDVNKLGDAFGNSYYVPNMIKEGTVRSDKVPYKTADVLYNYRTNPVDETKPAQSAAHRAAFYMATQCWNDLPEGELSLAIVSAVSPQLMTVMSPEVKFAIRHHDGAYGRARRDLTGNESPLQMMLHFGDMWSSRMAKEGYR